MNILSGVQKSGVEINQEETSASILLQNMDHFTFCTQSFKFCPLTRKTETSNNYQQETPQSCAVFERELSAKCKQNCWLSCLQALKLREGSSGVPQ